MPRRDIVVIGASAGGVATLQTILSALPWDLQASLFIVLHTTEDSPGVLPEILNRSSKLPALYAVNKAPVLPGRVLIAPPGARHLLLDRGQVRLVPGPRENRSRPAIDALFRSASQAYGPRVIGVVLTGNLDDGTAGLSAIKQRGGFAIVQDPEDAIAPSMPSSAIESTEVDEVLPAEHIGPFLVDLVTRSWEAVIQALPGGSGTINPSGQPYACPECGGVLEEMQEGEVARYRCRVGHMYSPESLLADQDVATEKALWAAIRGLEEQAEFAERLATKSHEKKRTRLAQRFSEKAETSREDATVLRALLEKTAEEIFETPEGKTGTE